VDLLPLGQLPAQSWSSLAAKEEQDPSRSQRLVQGPSPDATHSLLSLYPVPEDLSGRPSPTQNHQARSKSPLACKMPRCRDNYRFFHPLFTL